MPRWPRFLAVLPLAAAPALMGCQAEPTAGAPTKEQLEILQKNEPSAVPVSSAGRKIRPGQPTGSLGAQ
jgi:hypothetical protein